jgi:hypothetical protein
MSSSEPRAGQLIAGDDYGGEVIAGYHQALKKLTQETLTYCKSIRWRSILM